MKESSYLVKIGKIFQGCLLVYVALTLLTVIVAHILKIVLPDSGWSEQLVAPIASGIDFLDVHWKAVLLLITPFFIPFFVPYIKELLPRIRKVWGVELDPVSLHEVAAKKKKPIHSHEDKIDE